MLGERPFDLVLDVNYRPERIVATAFMTGMLKHPEGDLPT